MSSSSSSSSSSSVESNFKYGLVTGGNKGIGFAVVRALAKSQPNATIILGARDAVRGKEAVNQLQEEGLKNGMFLITVVFGKLDVATPETVEEDMKAILKEYPRIDVLVNNAGIFPEIRVPFLETNFKTVEEVFRVNTEGPLKLCQILVPQMMERNWGRIVNMSSGAGQLSDMNGRSVAYRLSKVSLNALTRILNDELKEKNILVNSMCPGFVKTDMTKGAGKKTPEEAAETALWLATLPDDGPRGGFFRDKKEIPW